MEQEKPTRPETRQLVREILADPYDPDWRNKVARAILDRKQVMAETGKPWSLELPNGTYLYPRLYRSIVAFRDGEPPNLRVVLECRKDGGEVDVERVHCESWEEFARVMAEHFPGVLVEFRERQP